MKTLAICVGILAGMFAPSAQASGIKICKVFSQQDMVVPVPETWSLADCQFFAKQNAGHLAQAICLYDDVSRISNIWMAGKAISPDATPTADDLPGQACGWKAK
jgi:hypothetical protein